MRYSNFLIERICHRGILACSCVAKVTADVPVLLIDDLIAY